MANTSALRKKIEQQIKALQAKLKAIEVVEQLALEESSASAASRERARDHHLEEHAREHSMAGTAITETIQDTAAKVLSDEWARVQEYHELVRAIHPNVRLAAVSTAMRRLTTRGVAESRGRRKEGLEYRRLPSGRHGRAPM